MFHAGARVLTTLVGHMIHTFWRFKSVAWQTAYPDRRQSAFSTEPRVSTLQRHSGHLVANCFHLSSYFLFAESPLANEFWNHSKMLIFCFHFLLKQTAICFTFFVVGRISFFLFADVDIWHSFHTFLCLLFYNCTNFSNCRNFCSKV